MLKRLSRHFSYANVVASLALFMALSGTAYAVATITGADVVDESLTGADVKGKAATATSPEVAGTLTGYDLKDLSVWGRDIADNVISGKKVTDNALTGDDVLESSLGQVPSASSADSSGFAYAVGSDSVGPIELVDPEKWHYIGDPGEPVFQNGWSNYDTNVAHTDAQYQHVGFARDSFGVVHLRGLVKGGTIGATMFALPPSYCPWFYHAYGVLSNNAFARVTITWVSAGGCFVSLDIGSNAWVSLEGVSFQNYLLENRSAAALSSAPSTPSSLPGSPPIDGPKRSVPKR